MEDAEWASFEPFLIFIRDCSNFFNQGKPDGTLLLDGNNQGTTSAAKGSCHILAWHGVAFAPIENPYRGPSRLSPCRGRFARVEEIAGEYRSEERREGKAYVSTCRSRRSPYH